MSQMSSTVIQIATQTLGGDMIVLCSFLYAFGTIYKTSNTNSFGTATLITKENTKT